MIDIQTPCHLLVHDRCSNNIALTCSRAGSHQSSLAPLQRVSKALWAEYTDPRRQQERQRQGKPCSVHLGTAGHIVDRKCATSPDALFKAIVYCSRHSNASCRSGCARHRLPARPWQSGQHDQQQLTPLTAPSKTARLCSCTKDHEPAQWFTASKAGSIP
jgi:hypothetical protein